VDHLELDGGHHAVTDKTVTDQAVSEKPTPVVDMIDTEFFETLNGYEEHTIKKAWDGVVITKVGKDDPSTWLRCLAFIHFKRQGNADPMRPAMDLSLGDLGRFFAEDPDRAKNPLETSRTALAAVVDAEDLATAQAAARKALEDLDGGGAPGEAK